jgi:L-threonylcarbamoyladenylate synthase
MNIKTDLLSLNHPKAFDRALEVIRAGGVVAFPTDTIYGIGVSAFNQSAVEKIYQVKGRSHLKAIPILLSDKKELSQVAINITPSTSKIIQKYWPGALTLVLPGIACLPDNLSTTESIGVRVPDDNLTRELLRRTGPLAATSANLSGRPGALTAFEVLDQLGGKVDLVLDGGPARGRQASTVLDLTGAEPQLLREGPISLEEILQALDE